MHNKFAGPLGLIGVTLNLHMPRPHWEASEGVDLLSRERCPSVSPICNSRIFGVDLAKQPTIKLSAHLVMVWEMKEAAESVVYDVLTMLAL